MRMSTLKNNTTELQTLLDTANALPDASGGDESQAYGFLYDTLTEIDCDVTSVRNSACQELSNLKTVNLPECTTLGISAFAKSGIETINAPKLTSVGTYTFERCEKLQSVNFPLLKAITSGCFSYCYALAKADFGALESIANTAFTSCSSLVTLILRNTTKVCTLANIGAFSTSVPIRKGTGYIYVPSVLIDSYKTATNWSTVANQFRTIEDYPDICG